MLRRKAQRVVERSGLLPRQPRPQGARRDPRDVSARRAVPDLGGRALRDGARASSTSASAGACGCSSAATRSAASSPVSSTCRASASTPRTGSGSRTSSRRRSAGRASTTRRASPSRCWRASTSSSTPSQGAVPEYDVAEIEARLAAATRAWTDDLRDALSEQLGEERAGPLFERYGEAFPGAYREDFTARQAVPDIERIERLDPDGDLGMSLYVPLDVDARPPRLQARSARAGRSSSRTCCRCSRTWASGSATSGRTRSSRADGPPVWIYDFGLRHDAGAEFQADDVREMFQDAFARAWRGESENDGFNRLVLSARLTAREITILRAIAKYLRQAGSTFSQTYMEDALSAHPDVARGIVELFRLRLDPARFRGHGREGARARARARERDRRGREPRRGPDPARLPARRPRRAADELLPDGRRRPGEAVPLAQARSRPRSRTCPSRGRCSRSSSTRRAWRPCTSAAARSRAAASAGPTGARTSAPRCSG